MTDIPLDLSTLPHPSEVGAGAIVALDVAFGPYTQTAYFAPRKVAGGWEYTMNGMCVATYPDAPNPPDFEGHP